MATHDIRRAANVDIPYNIREEFLWSGTVTLDGSPVDLSGKTLLYSIRSTENGSAVATASTASEIVVSGANNNIVTITIDSISGIKERTYFHDLENTTDNKMIFDGKLICTYGAYNT
jgi:hypothetical protein